MAIYQIIEAQRRIYTSMNWSQLGNGSSPVQCEDSTRISGDVLSNGQKTLIKEVVKIHFKILSANCRLCCSDLIAMTVVPVQISELLT